MHRSTVGEELLVHAGTAIAKLEREELQAEVRRRVPRPRAGRALAGEILALVEPGRHYKLMEVCGGHTHSIYSYGIEDLLPANSSWFTAPAARSASSRWAGSTTASRSPAATA